MSTPSVILSHSSGSLELDRPGKLLQKFLSYDGFTAPIIEAYDNWIKDGLRTKIHKTKLQLKGDNGADAGMIGFANATLDPPTMGIQDSRDRSLNYSSELYADLTYSPPLINGAPPEENNLGRILLGKIPVIIGSSLSKVYNQTETQLLEMGEDPHDPNGYFINKGTEKIVLIQEKLRMNRVFVFVGDKKGGKKSQSKGSLVARMTCATPTGSTLVLLKEGKIRDIDLSLHFMGKNNEGEQNSISVISAFRILGQYIDAQEGIQDYEAQYSNNTNIINTILRFAKDHIWSSGSSGASGSDPVQRQQQGEQNDRRWQKKVWIALQPSILRDAQQSQRADAYDTLIDKIYGRETAARTDAERQARRDRVNRGLMEELFPQIEYNNPIKKYEMLAMMVARFLEVLSGLRKADDRDNWGNKRLETAAIAIERLFNCAFDQSMKATQKTLDANRATRETAIKAFVHQNTITENFTSSFNGTNWGCKGSYSKENITDILKRDNIIASYSHLRRVNTPTSRKAKQPSIRLVPMSSLGYICPIETPEGENLGIVKNLTTGCYISINRDELPVRQSIARFINENWAENTDYKTKCLLNGRLLGWCNGPELLQFARTQRRQALFPRDTCIALDNDNVLHIYTDGSRPVRPLLIVDDGNMGITIRKPGPDFGKPGIPGRLVIDELDMWEAEFPDLLNSGCVEYIDAFEQEFIKLAYNFDNLESIKGSIAFTEANLKVAQDNLARIQLGQVVMEEVIIGGVAQTSTTPLKREDAENRVKQLREVLESERRRRPYTHCELDPQSIISISSSTIPFPHHNQAPRNTYQCTSGQTLVTCADGTVKTMETIENGDSILTIDPVTFEQKMTTVKSHFVVSSEVAGKKVFKITTMNGRELVATEDHQFLTLRGFVELKDLLPSDRVAIWGSQEAEYQRHLDYFAKTQEMPWTREEWSIQTVPKNNCLFLPIRSITAQPACMVGDFETEAPTHTFVADGFVTHNCTMAKQALGIPGSNYQNRFDTTMKMLALPTKPLFVPQIDGEIGLNDLPVGQNAIIAIKTEKGFNQEDSFVFNEAAIDRGFFRMIKYIVKKTTLKRTKEIREFFEIPKIGPNDGDRYTNITEDGSPRVGAILRQNDAVIGRVVQILSDNTKQNATIFVGLSEEGIVDRVLRTTTDDGSSTIKVRIRQVRNVLVGDKFAPRHAQKGTVGLIEKPHKMPFVEKGPNEGLIPSIIINPHSIPSRMTIAMLLELVQSKICAMTGKRFNATAFRSINIDEILATLRQFGYDQYSNETLISGRTGKRITTEIFMGPVYYQALRHHVKDKIQMRSRGSVNPSTRQAIGGRVRRGGLRFGEMERDSVISAGCASLLRERLCDASDAYRVVYCKTCGVIAITNVDNKQYRCRFCGDNAEFGVVIIPYAFKLLVHLLYAADFNLRLLLSDNLLDAY